MLSRRRSGIIPWLGAAVPLVPIVAGIIMTSGSVPAAALGPGLQPAASAPAGNQAAASSAATTPGAAAVAILRTATTMRAAPGGQALGHVGLRTPFGSPTVMPVAAARRGWLGVISPVAGNRRLGWIPQGSVTLTRVDWELRVSLAARQLTVLQAGRPVEHYAVAIGEPAAPTPTGRFAVTDRLNTGDPAGPYGCCILALSALAPHAIQGWSGGNRIAIHSTPETSSIGHPVSHGCVRLTLAEGRWLLAHIPLGTPTVITA